MKALFPIFSRPRDVSEFFKVRLGESVPNRRPRAIMVDVGVEDPKSSNYKSNAIKDVGLSEYFSYVRRFWNDITLFIVPDSHDINEHFKRLDESINYFEKVRFYDVMRYGVPIVVCHYCDDEKIFKTTIGKAIEVRKLWRTVVIGVPGTIVTSIRGKFKCVEDINRCNKFIASLITRLVDAGFSRDIHILGIRKRTFTFLHEVGLARHVLSGDTDASNLAPNEKAKEELRKRCPGCYQVINDSELMDKWYIEWFKPYEPILTVEEWLLKR
jgi:hypothetical protein